MDFFFKKIYVIFKMHVKYFEHSQIVDMQNYQNQVNLLFMYYTIMLISLFLIIVFHPPCPCLSKSTNGVRKSNKKYLLWGSTFLL